MKFRLKTKDYREFRGRVFAWGKPVEVTDIGTIEALTGHPDFEVVPDEPINGKHVVGTLKLPKRKRNEAVL